MPHLLMHEAGHPLHEKIALDLLESDGIATIWLLHLIAARAYRDGHSHSAEILIATADAAERMIAAQLEIAARRHQGSEKLAR